MPTITFNLCREPIYPPGSPSTPGTVIPPAWRKAGGGCADSGAVSRLNYQPLALALPQKREYLFPELSLPLFPGTHTHTHTQLFASAHTHTQPSLLEHHNTHTGTPPHPSHPPAVLAFLQSQEIRGGKEIVTQIWQICCTHLPPIGACSPSPGSCCCCCCCSLYQPQQCVGLLSVVCKPEIKWFSQAPLAASCPQGALRASPSPAETSRARSRAPVLCMSHPHYSFNLKGK